MPIKVLCIAGTRPEAIKMAPVVNELRRRPEHFDVILCSTGQHRELLRDTLRDFGLQPDINLDVMTDNQSLPSLFAKLLERIDEAIRSNAPDWVLVQGDTASVAAASLAAHFNKVNIGHVEAGLRSGDKWNPFPEEINRQIVSVCADLNFTPTSFATEALLREGIDPRLIVETGNTVVDALLHTIETAGDKNWKELLGLDYLDNDERVILVVTLHRRESHGQPMRRVLSAITEFLNTHPEVHVIFPVHPNPNVKSLVFEMFGESDRVSLIEPLPYTVFSQVLANSHLILTDSGGVQEEAPSLGVHVIVARETTERPEGVMAGTTTLVGTEPERILRALEEQLAKVVRSDMRQVIASPFGDGKASIRIADAIQNWR